MRRVRAVLPGASDRRTGLAATGVAISGCQRMPLTPLACLNRPPGPTPRMTLSAAEWRLARLIELTDRPRINAVKTSMLEKRRWKRCVVHMVLEVFSQCWQRSERMVMADRLAGRFPHVLLRVQVRRRDRQTHTFQPRISREHLPDRSSTVPGARSHSSRMGTSGYIVRSCFRWCALASACMV